MGFISNLFGYPLGLIMKFLYGVFNNYIVALILFTLVTKIIMFPLSIKQQKSTAQMAVFKPKLDAIQKKFANDKNRQNEEMMKLYTEYGYNPSSGCLPLLIQFPILFGLIDVIYKPLTHVFSISSSALSSATEIAKNMLGSAYNITNAEVSIINAVKENASAFAKVFNSAEIESISAFDMTFLGLDLSATPTFGWNILMIIPILAGITMIAQTFFTTRLSGSAQVTGGSGNVMMYSMSLFTVVFTFSVPAGVGLYWIVSNILAIGQSFVLNKIYNPKKLAAEYEEKIAAIEEAKKKKVKVEVNKDGKKQVVEKTLTEKEINRMRLAKARELDNEKYGAEENLPSFGEVDHSEEETKAE